MIALRTGIGTAASLAARSRIASKIACKAIPLTALALLGAISSATAASLPASQYLTAPGAITAVWANNGEDKVAQEELRTKTGNRPVLNRSWDGRTVRLFGARNEVVAFNLVLEAGLGSSAKQVSLQFDRLAGPNGFAIRSLPVADKQGVFGTYDEQHIPERFRRPQAADGSYNGGWTDRPDHDKSYPDIAVPMEAAPTFTIGGKKNQSVWVDVYIPQDAPAGLFTGEVLVKIGGVVAYRVPVQLAVRDFALANTPASKTMLATSFHDVAERYTGTTYPSANSQQDQLTKLVMNRQMLLAHRHKISLIDDNSGASAWTSDRPRPEWEPRLSGALFTAAYGYNGPGAGIGNNVFSIGTYGQWQDWWGAATADSIRNHTNGWESWFAANSPSTERFLYLIDESEDYAQTETWAGWMRSNPGPGANLKSFATGDLLKISKFVPSLSISASWIAVGQNALWQNAINSAQAAGKQVYLYNGQRPASGSFATEDDGIALRELAWGQYKKKIDRWFFWEATYYNDYQSGRGQTNVFVNAQTFGGTTTFDPNLGMTGWNASNGDGVLFYPGIDKKFPKESLGLQGPIASLRLKHWRRGIQDVDYLTIAAKINPTAVAALVQKMVPKVLWENDVTDPDDPTWVIAPISWSTNPDDWEAARLQLADIIEGG